jgi:hypothetical protein
VGACVVTWQGQHPALTFSLLALLMHMDAGISCNVTLRLGNTLGCTRVQCFGLQFWADEKKMFSLHALSYSAQQVLDTPVQLVYIEVNMISSVGAICEDDGVP